MPTIDLHSECRFPSCSNVWIGSVVPFLLAILPWSRIQARNDTITAAGLAWLVGTQILASGVRSITRGFVRCFPLLRYPLEANQIVTEDCSVRPTFGTLDTSLNFSYAVHLREPNE